MPPLFPFLSKVEVRAFRRGSMAAEWLAGAQSFTAKVYSRLDAVMENVVLVLKGLCYHCVCIMLSPEGGRGNSGEHWEELHRC